MVGCSPIDIGLSPFLIKLCGVEARKIANLKGQANVCRGFPPPILCYRLGGGKLDGCSLVRALSC